MRFAVFGTGAVGGYFGGRLAQAGHEVHFIARGRHLEAIRGDGLRVDSIRGDFVVAPAHATDDPADVGAVDVVLVAVKGWQLDEAAAAIAPLVGEETVVLSLLNGVDAADRLAAAVGREHVLGGLCRISASIAGPGHIRHVAVEPTVIFGELDNRSTERASELRRAFEEAGIVAQVANDIHVAIWEKFMLIATWSGIGAVTRATVGEWRSLPGTRAMAESCLEEIRAIARARGVDVPPASVARILSFIDGVAAGGTASMQRDVMEGRPSELEAQNGTVVRLAEECDVAAPTHAFLYASLLPQERAARVEAARA